MSSETEAQDAGRIVTFYSYKGGTGRTMALVNVGWIMASNGKRVLLVDWDLEAPGLHRYLRPFLLDPKLRDTDGLINMVNSFVGQVIRPGEPLEPGAGTTVMSDDELRSHARLGPRTTGLDLRFPGGGRLDFLPAGRMSPSYSADVTSFNWRAFYERLGGGSFLQVLREEMKASYDYVLIDSRTGVSDISGICTTVMPDVLVDGFVLNHQSIEGGLDVAQSVASEVRHPVRILPVPMRVEDGEQELLEWGRDLARAEFGPFLSWLGESEQDQYWGEVEVPYKKYYAYAEIPATVRDRPSQPGNLLAAFERLTSWITDGRVRSLAPHPEDERQRMRAAYLDPRTSWPRIHVSYASADRMWAEWIAARLEVIGYQVSLHSTAEPDAGTLPEVAPVLKGRGRMLALLSPEYMAQRRAQEVWKQLRGLESADRALLAVRVQEFETTARAPFRGRFAADLTHRTPEEAEAQLLSVVGPVRRARVPGSVAPAPDAPAPPFPGTSPSVQRVPSRNVSFTGRGFLLERLRNGFTSGSTTQVLYGLGGVGKTQIAQEYAHRFKAAYDVVWWVPAAQPGLIRPALADLAPRLGLEVGEDVGSTAESVLRALRRGEPFDRWLLVYDNAGRPEQLAAFLPTGPPGGHVLLTSRDRTWVNDAGLVEVEVFQRQESTDLLHRLNTGLTASDAEEVARELGDLPLAVAQAAVWLSESSMPVATYLALLKDRLTEVLQTTQLPERDYPHSAAATWNLAVDELRRVNQAAAEMLEICSFFGPDPIPLRLLYSKAVTKALTLPSGEPRDEMAVAQLVRTINRFGLAKSDQSSATLTVHRLVQAVIRDQVDDARKPQARGVVHAALVDADPGDPDVPADWDRYAELLPHLRPSLAAESPDPEVRKWVTDSVRYLWKRGLRADGQELAERTLARWKTCGIGHPDDPQTLMLRIQLGNVLRSRGRLEKAYEIDRDTFERFHRTKGPDYAHTLAAAGNVAADLRALGRYVEARELDRKTLDGALRTLGDDHPRTLMYTSNLGMSEYLAGDRRAALDLHELAYRQQSEARGRDNFYSLLFASNYARDLRETGSLREALDLLRTTVQWYEQTLGDSHPETLRTRRNLAVALRRAGDYEQAKKIDEDIHSRYVEAHGTEHTDTLAAACGLACDLAALGEPQRARQLAERAMDRYGAYLGAEHPVTLACATNLSVYQRLTGSTDSARELSHKALHQMSRIVGESHPYSLSCMINHANDLALAGDLEAAVEWDRRARRYFLDILGPDHYDAISITSNLGLSLRATGRTEEAARLAAEAARRAQDKLGETHPTTRTILAGKRLDSDIEPPTT
ncbi:FxSxx-COOH system tetratricopeptide repeat protein [Streptomyces sp. SP17KL33]|uniref:FxSxx-COOH system tetratricopeptide repeat protein n=1 Tax=Streptomyces sp. SP17KL33 TaxID=3002534 RepID=UPI002E759FF0|nr:FxSxx-COOH system tetratricopeptide repeat protein [Streptomyces sp. SP17KL33]MEE1833370.1 FxSxx-COOH system tetratricopeptide repeat protein [Streptomyces sp. SP17KL33]